MCVLVCVYTCVQVHVHMCGEDRGWCWVSTSLAFHIIDFFEFTDSSKLGGALGQWASGSCLPLPPKSDYRHVPPCQFFFIMDAGTPNSGPPACTAKTTSWTVSPTLWPFSSNHVNYFQSFTQFFRKIMQTQVIVVVLLPLILCLVDWETMALVIVN